MTDIFEQVQGRKYGAILPQSSDASYLDVDELSTDPRYATFDPAGGLLGDFGRGITAVQRMLSGQIPPQEAASRASALLPMMGLMGSVPSGALASNIGLLSVFPKPQRYFAKEGEDVPGGRYIVPATNQDITGSHRDYGRIFVNPETGKGSMKVAGDVSKSPDLAVMPRTKEKMVQTNTSGAPIRANLAKKSTGWKWVGEAPKGYENAETLVTIETKNKHLYSLEVDYPKGLTLSRYAKKKDEPKLRPAAKGTPVFGKQVGTIGKQTAHGYREHPVYDKISIE